jgi:hypothetical protein
VIDEVKSDLNATDTQIGLSLSMFILYVFSLLVDKVEGNGEMLITDYKVE